MQTPVGKEDTVERSVHTEASAGLQGTGQEMLAVGPPAERWQLKVTEGEERVTGRPEESEPGAGAVRRARD